MKQATPKFTKKELGKHLRRLNDELRKMEVTGEICIVGGAAMLLGFGSRESTRDIDSAINLRHLSFAPLSKSRRSGSSPFFMAQ